MTPEDRASALVLIQNGVPLFLAKPAAQFPEGGHGETGYLLPVGWQNTKPDPAVLDEYQDGMALCAVMGHAVDGLDIDAQKGGALPPDLLPVSYGRQSTPSGGSHDLIAPLRLRSRDGLALGVDYKGGIEGIGHGFLFLAPTRKRSKTTGEIAQYEWAERPNSTSLAMMSLVEEDTSGAALSLFIRSGRRAAPDGRPDYDGPSYPELSPERRGLADQYHADTLLDWRFRLGDASGWAEKQTDQAGRGWEALCRDAAWTVARLAACPWVGLDPNEARSVYEGLLPEVMAQDPKCKNKWYDGIIEKASALSSDQPPWWSETFLEQTEVLRSIQQAALSVCTVPQGMLAVLLARVLAEVPPSVMLPSIATGGEGGATAGFNMGVALVSRSGGGKSTTIKASRQFLGLVGLDQKEIEEGVGSGEGMIDTFLEEERVTDDKGKSKGTGVFVVKPDPRAIFIVDEIEQLAAAGKDRAGSTLTALMRTGLTGGALKTANARAGGRYRAVPEDTYRLVVVVGVQPGRADVLLSPSEEAVGTPQRFLWVRTTDKDLRLPEILPDWPASLNWEPPGEWPTTVEYPEHVREALLRQRRDQSLELASGAEGHAMLTRLKVAFALGLLHGDTKISDQWWSLAGLLIDQSRLVQQDCKRTMAEANQAREVYRATTTAKALSVAEETVSEDRLKACTKAVVRRLAKTPGEAFRWSQIKPHNRLRQGLETADIMDSLTQEPGVAVDRVGGPGGSTRQWLISYSPPRSRPTIDD